MKPIDAYLDVMFSHLDNSEDIYVVSADTNRFRYFQKQKQNRFVSVGIAEMNMLEVACGLALAGKYPVCYSPMPFPYLRGLDQLRNSVCAMRLPMTIIGLGTSAGHNGYSHSHSEYISILRTLPGMKIVNVTDCTIARMLAETEHNAPVFAGFDTDITGTLYNEPPEFDDGIGVIREGTDVAVITCGYETSRCIEVAAQLEASGISCKLIDIFTIPYNAERLIAELNGTDKIITVEGTSRQGGLGSAVLETLSDAGVVKPVKRLATDYKDAFPTVFGERDYWEDVFGTSDSHIFAAVKEIVNK